MTRTFLAAVVLIGVTGVGVAAQRGQRGFPPPPPNGAPPPQGPGQGPGRGGPGGRGGGPDGLGGLNTPESNPMTPEKIAAGRKLFFDTSLSADKKTSCATCHDPAHAFTDGRAIAKGAHDAMGTRNSPTLVNAGNGRSFFWDGRAESLEAQVLQPMTNPKEMGLSDVEIEKRTGMKVADVTNALASYVRTIRSHESRVDYFRAGQTGMLNADEQAGFDIFRGKGQCGPCHGGPNFTDDRFHNTGVGLSNGSNRDEGRYAVSHDERDRAAFKTPTLRDIALTAPYMHDGSLATLDEVVDFYSKGGNRNSNLDPRMRPLNLSADEKRQLVAFLKAMSGRITEGLPR
jgi:cytochrome c peroxidase